MRSHYLLDPQLRTAVDNFPVLDLSSSGLPQARARMDAARVGWTPEAEEEGEVMLRDYVVTANGRRVRVLIYRPRQAEGPLPAFLHLHGGGYVMGSPAMDDRENRQIAHALGCAVMSVDYALAPERPFPEGLEDCYAALTWLHGHAGPLGLDAGRIAIGGKSAGGGLAAALALLARDQGEVPLLFQQLVYPMIDDRPPADPHPFTGEFVFRPEDATHCWEHLLGPAAGGPYVPVHAAAARAEDLSRLPPAFISVGALDLFLDSNLDYACRLTRAGVPVELHVYPGAVHGFDLVAGAEVTLAHAQDRLRALRRAFAASGWADSGRSGQTSG